ncbi:cuticle protein 19-like [Penaeus japonicus]|uniref:cuticle protein 19-like n=1 Tax=Penaeus japonicus TaxID=27405 RepID=UPI001C70EA70|nr:cuticle protein 19-like [Penaeus japonicus]
MALIGQGKQARPVRGHFGITSFVTLTSLSHSSVARAPVSDATRRVTYQWPLTGRVCLPDTAVLLALVAVAFAAPSQPAYGYAPEPTYEEPAKYDFNYPVKDDYTGNDFGHQETRDGYDTQGSYYVLLPDGRLQKVTYTVKGDSGFVAEVSYEGEAQYPEYKPA